MIETVTAIIWQKQKILNKGTDSEVIGVTWATMPMKTQIDRRTVISKAKS